MKTPTPQFSTPGDYYAAKAKEAKRLWTLVQKLRQSGQHPTWLKRLEARLELAWYVGD